MDGFSKYHNFKFELNGIRVWRAYGIGKGKVIPYQDIIVKPQGPTDLVVDVEFFSVKEVRTHKTLRQVMTSKAAVSSCALSLDVRWCSRNSVSLRVILMLANTAKYPEPPKQCTTNSEETGPKNSLLLTRKPAAH